MKLFEKRVGVVVAAVLLAGGAVVVGVLGGCGGGYVEVGTGREIGYYDYSYYPDTQVYYYPAAREYYWYDRNRWDNGRELPRHIRVDRDRNVTLRLRTARPYEQHEQVRREHPGRGFANDR